MNKYITELFELLTDECNSNGGTEIEITATDDVLTISRCKTEMLYAVLEFVKKHKFRAELDGGVIRIECRKREGKDDY